MSEENKKIDSLKEKLFYTQKHASGDNKRRRDRKRPTNFATATWTFCALQRPSAEATEYFVENAEKLGFNRLSAAEKYKSAIKYI